MSGARDTVFEFEQALAKAGGGDALAVAYSGGLDSTVLLHLAHAHTQKNGRRLFAFHVHHGLNAKADDWLKHCRQTCEHLAICFDARHVVVRQEGGEGIEAAARRARYDALVRMCRSHGVLLLLTAHHEDDQAETVLMQLVRGGGVAGLSGMETLGSIPGEKETSCRLLRPLLRVSGRAIRELAQEEGLVWTEDDSNLDLRYARNALRLKVAPVLSGLFPGFERRIARSAQHVQSASRLLYALAEMDWASCREGNMLDTVRMAALSGERVDNLLRFWLARQGLRMPSTAWLREAERQLLYARKDAQVRLSFEGAVIRRFRQYIVFQEPKKADEDDAPRLPQALGFWQGASKMAVESFGGELIFESAEEGADAAWLLTQPLKVSAYNGKAVLKVAHNRPAKALKAHFQERGVPAWERPRLPLLYAGERLLYVAGIGMAADLSGRGENRIGIGWRISG